MKGCRPLTPEEVREVLDHFYGDHAARDRALFALGVSSGFRLSELLALRVVDLFAGPTLRETVRLARSKMKGKRTSRSIRIAPFASEFLIAARASLASRRRDHPASPFFQSRSATPRALSRAQAHRLFAQAFARADLYGASGELASHCMRKTFAARMWAHFGDVFSVQVALGHASPSSTVAYLDIDAARITAAIDAQFPRTEFEPTSLSTSITRAGAPPPAVFL